MFADVCTYTVYSATGTCQEFSRGTHSFPIASVRDEMRAETFTTCTTDQTKLWLNSVSATQARVLMTFLDIEPKEALILSWMLIQDF